MSAERLQPQDVMTITTSRKIKDPVDPVQLATFVNKLKEKIAEGFVIMGYGTDMTFFGKKKGIKVIDGYQALRSVWQDNTPTNGGSLSLTHLIPSLLGAAELHQAFQDSFDTVLVFRTLLVGIGKELKWEN